MKNLIAVGIASSLVTMTHLLPLANAAERKADSGCAKRWGEPGAPLVKNAETAKAIFLAVERDFFPAADRPGFPDVAAREDGSSWTVFRWRAPVAGADGTTTVTMGGGQLSLRIAKCDGAISEVWLSR